MLDQKIIQILHALPESNHIKHQNINDLKEENTSAAPVSAVKNKLTKLDHLSDFILQVTLTTDANLYEMTNALLFSYSLFGNSLRMFGI